MGSVAYLHTAIPENVQEAMTHLKNITNVCNADLSSSGINAMLREGLEVGYVAMRYLESIEPFEMFIR